ncbi:uncharacterized protein LOC129582283 [Paramacrobiotus metropolitanus]|uniref:uncharacterized protein LOC129582283 n=1 Tax=Paramacrobiotus metropolitanus TaxID=2943436 RepID=UPI002445F105|nr:uncharacterized protein LOC129582283 [Paramacrobiotus metropolitanus]
MNKLVVIAAVCVMFLVAVDAASNIHCTWHGTAPFCMPSCPKGKKAVDGTKSNCGPNKIACCITGKKLVCCPNDWQGNAANAMAIAKT